MNSAKEIWCDIPMFVGMYQASNLGNTRSLDRLISCDGGKRRYEGIILRKQINRLGYETIRLLKKTYLIDRLVALTFLKATAEKTEANHKNGNKSDNSVKNLEWVTRSRNCKHNYRVLNRKKKFRGEHHLAKSIKATHEKTGEILEFDSVTSAVDSGFDQSAINRALSGKWKQYKGYVWSYA